MVINSKTKILFQLVKMPVRIETCKKGYVSLFGWSRSGISQAAHVVTRVPTPSKTLFSRAVIITE